MLDVLEAMRCVLLCMPEVPEMLEVIRCVLLCLLEEFGGAGGAGGDSLSATLYAGGCGR